MMTAAIIGPMKRAEPCMPALMPMAGAMSSGGTRDGAMVKRTGWVKVWAVDPKMSLVTVSHACDSIEIGDYLEPFALPKLAVMDPNPAKPQRENYALIAGATSHTAKERMVDILRNAGDLEGEPRAITHPVKFFEKGDRPLEIITSRQWFIKTVEYRDELLARGRELQWHPEYMRHRYESWVNGLVGDWCISRQRFFGVPFPVWYPVGADGVVRYDRPIVPAEGRLPIDPSTDCPDGFTEDQRGRSNGFMGDPDVMDTWATSSVSPEIAARWEDDPDLFARVFPMDLRPQGHDIIRTWLFSTMVRSNFEHNIAPWKNALEKQALLRIRGYCHPALWLSRSFRRTVY